MNLEDSVRRLLAILGEMDRVVVAFSGGVDSAVVAKAAYLAVGERAIAVTADSPSVPRAELANAQATANLIGIEHRIVLTSEFADPEYVLNDGRRCYFCKSELYGRLQAMLADHGQAVICSGANLDDLGDYRPGLIAAAERGVRHPLQEAGFGKAEVRALAREWGLPIWDKPASPCLSSRIAPGVEATPERAARIEAAEAILHGLGLRECRVRLHPGELGRIEVPFEAISMLAAPEVRIGLAREMRDLGFAFVTLDLEGFRTGSLNSLVSLETKKIYHPLSRATS